MKKMNNKGFAISTVIYGTFILFIMLLAILLASINSSLRLLDNRVDNKNNYKIYEEGNGVEAPDLSTGLIPVVYDDAKGEDTHWFVADTTQEWYNYDDQIWANAVSVKTNTKNKYVKNGGTYIDGEEIESSDWLAMFVWIPRFSYTIGCADLNKNGDGEDDGCYGYRLKNDSEKVDGYYRFPSGEYPGAIDIKFISKGTTDTLPNKVTNEKFPRYDYNAENGNPTSDRKPDNWYTHPAFWWDDNLNGTRESNEEIPGFWIGKFVTSVDEESGECFKYMKSSSTNSSGKIYCKTDDYNIYPRILPNSVPLVYQSMYDKFNTAKQFEKVENGYGIKADAHMSKNSEWSAVAYLYQSEYGKYGNVDYDLKNKEVYLNFCNNTNGVVAYTGRTSGAIAKVTLEGINSCGKYKYDNTPISGGTIEKYKGTGASTTGNIYGVYDMNTSIGEMVMGTYTGYGATNNSDGFSNTNVPSSIYFDKIEYSSSDNELTEKKIKVLGQALFETEDWYLDNVGSNNTIEYSGNSAAPWIRRGVGMPNSTLYGLFNIFYHSGNADAKNPFRVSLVKP